MPATTPASAGPPRRLTGALNFRDVGGVPAGPDRRVRHGRLFRSDTLQFLTAADVDVLVGELGVRTDIDLRLPFELEVEGRGPIGETTVPLTHLPFQVPSAQRDGSATPILQASDPIVAHYCDYLTSSPDAVVGVVRALARPEALPAVVHCAAGKDRTGVAVAMVLAAVGCAAEDIATEYAAGSDVVAAVMARLSTMDSYGDSLSRLPPEASLTPPEYITRFFAAVDEQHGGVRAYLLARGVTPAELDALAAELTEPMPAADGAAR